MERNINMLRKIKTRLLIKKAIAYRVVVFTTQLIFMWLITRNIAFSLGTTALWNVINTIEYFSFDYVFAKLFKVGKE